MRLSGDWIGRGPARRFPRREERLGEPPPDLERRLEVYTERAARGVGIFSGEPLTDAVTIYDLVAQAEDEDLQAERARLLAEVERQRVRRARYERERHAARRAQEDDADAA